MPGPNTYNLSNVGLDRPILPYRSYTSPIDETPHWCAGSVNGLATVAGWMEKRSGFSTGIEGVLSAIPGVVNRLFTWQRYVSSLTNPGHFFVMASTMIGTTSAVYALDVTAGGSFTLIYTDSASTNPFDFVVDSNFVHFGNATTRENMRKWDGAIVSLWGVDAPLAAPDFSLTSEDLPAGLMFDPIACNRGSVIVGQSGSEQGSG